MKKTKLGGNPCDIFDGKVASTMVRTKPEKRFGIQIDSLRDRVCFGVLPALIAYQCSCGGFLNIHISAVYVLCALIRLAWFNVDDEQRQDSERNGHITYFGLSVTTSAVLITSLISSRQLLEVPADILCPRGLLLIAVPFVLPFKMRKPGTIGMIVMALCGAAIFALVLIGRRMIGTSKMVSFLYGTILGRCFLKIIMKLHLDRGIVRFLWSPYSKHLIEWYIRYNGIAVTPEERASFRSFREFFARTRADIQAVSRQAVIISLIGYGMFFWQCFGMKNVSDFRKSPDKE